MDKLGMEDPPALAEAVIQGRHAGLDDLAISAIRDSLILASM
jgi:hypothetical protein